MADIYNIFRLVLQIWIPDDAGQYNCYNRVFVGGSCFIRVALMLSKDNDQ